MIPANSTVLRKLYNQNVTKIGIESLKIGQYVRTINIDTGEYDYCKVTSIVKISLPRYEIRTTCFDVIYATANCKFMALDGLPTPWNPTHSFNLNTRLLKREAAKVLTPFIKSVKVIGYPSAFYDILIESDTPQAVLVDGYAKVFGYDRK